MLKDLDDRVSRALALRLANTGSYSLQEIAEVESKDHRLFPRGFVLSSGATDDFRSLCHFSRVELRPGREIRSHRKIIGPIIVFLKRVSWPLVKIHFTDTFRGLQEFNARTVAILAKQHIASVEQEKRAG